MADSKAAATAFLTSLLSKTLRITTSDTRLFVGEFKCTDADRNIILSRTHEYRLPSPAPAPASQPSTSDPSEAHTLLRDLTSRYLGLVVVPGAFITRIEVEEFASQVGNARSKYAALGRAGLGVEGGEGVMGAV